MITRTFTNRESAQSAFNSLHERGYSNDDINLITSDNTRKKPFVSDPEETEIGTKAVERAAKGSAIGGTVAAIAGIIAAVGSNLVNIVS
jgi:hypothetical protein